MRILVPAICAATLLIGAASAQQPPQSDPNATVLRLTETAEKMVRRDRLRAELRVEASGPDARRVQSDVNRRMSAALDRARAVSSVRPETGVSSIWEERPQNAPVRWRAVQSIILSAKDAPELLALVGELQGDGLLISSLGYELSPEAARSVEDELTQLALERLRQRAEKIAKSMGSSLARWRELRIGNTGAPPPRPPVPMRAAMSAEAFQAPVAEPGESTVRVTVEGDAVLEPADSRPP